MNSVRLRDLIANSRTFLQKFILVNQLAMNHKPLHHFTAVSILLLPSPLFPPSLFLSFVSLSSVCPSHSLSVSLFLSLCFSLSLSLSLFFLQIQAEPEKSAVLFVFILIIPTLGSALWSAQASALVLSQAASAARRGAFPCPAGGFSGPHSPAHCGLEQTRIET